MTSSKIALPMDSEEFWSNVLGSGWGTWDWWVGRVYSQGAAWDKVGEVTITAWDGISEGEDEITKTLDLDALVAAYGKCRDLGYRINLDDLDAMEGDVIVQVAMYGDVVYG